jgi:t-SNARE complex subunit (syntaxin)
MQSTAPTFDEINEIKGRIDALDNRTQSLKTRIDNEVDDSEIYKEFEDLKHTIQECKQHPYFEKIAAFLQRRLETVKGNYQIARREYEKREERQNERRYKIIGGKVPTSHPEVENGSIFANYLLETDKNYQSTHALSNVTNRHTEVQNIEGGVSTLARLFEEVEELIKQQEEPIKASELNSEQTAGQVEQGITEETKAIKHIRSRNSKRWWALLIAGM